MDGCFRSILTIAVMAAALAACATVADKSDESPEAASTRQLYADLERERAARPEVEEVVADYGVPMLRVITTSQLTDGRVVHLRGRIHNPLPEPVHGVWLLFRAYARQGVNNPRELDVVQREMDVSIPSDGTVALRWDLESMYLMGAGGFNVEAYPQRIGDRELSPPPDWKE